MPKSANFLPPNYSNVNLRLIQRVSIALIVFDPRLNCLEGTQGLKRSISGPFAFQHLTHGDQSRFQSLDSVSKTDLTSDFIAVQSSQHPADEIRGIPVTDLPVNKDEPKIEIGLDEPASPTTDAIPLLPTTPPRPSPPPKDGLMSPYNPSDFRMSRSMENFSRPTRLSVTAFDISPKSASSNRLSVMNPVGQANISALVKPLPLLPDSQVVHAVSTKDDIALPLRTAPLPSPPKPVMEMVEEETTEENAELQSLSPRPLPPNLHIIPTEMSKQHKRRSQSSGEIRFDVLYPEVIKNAGEEASPKTRQRISIGVKPIDIKDWEDAIDYSWEHAAELEAEEDPFTSPMRLRQPSGISIPHENYLVVEQRSIDDASSSASTPLMMYAAGKSSQEEAPVSLQSRQVSPLMGLGIGALRPGSSVSLSDAAAISHDRRTSNFQPEEVGRSQTMRSPASVMSKSSSQESIIASIFGTQRSSNSSTSLSDFAHLASGSFGGSMEHLKLDLQDFTFTPTERHFREGSQDTIREDVEHTKSIEALADIGIISPFPNFTASPAVKHDRGMSASQVPIVPERKSSMPGATDTSRTPAGRKRSNTASSRSRRNTRVSYSLFPAPATN